MGEETKKKRTLFSSACSRQARPILSKVDVKKVLYILYLGTLGTVLYLDHRARRYLSRLSIYLTISITYLTYCTYFKCLAHFAV